MSRKSWDQSPAEPPAEQSALGITNRLYEISQQLHFDREKIHQGKEGGENIDMEKIQREIIALARQLIVLTYPGQDILASLPHPTNKQEEFARGGIVQHTAEVVRISIPYRQDQATHKHQADIVPGIEKKWSADEIDIYFEKGKPGTGNIIVEIPKNQIA